MGIGQSIQSCEIPRTPLPKVPSAPKVPSGQQHQNLLKLISCACETKFTLSITTRDTYCVYTLHLESEILDICTIDIYAFNVNDYESYVVRLNDYYGDPSTLNSTTPLCPHAPPLSLEPAHINTYEFEDIKQWYTHYPYKKLETMREVVQEIFNICGKGTFGAYGATFLLQ
jgi:hypothetical protein